MAAIVLFLYANIANIESGVGYGYLAFALACVTFIVLVRPNPAQAIAFRRSSIFLLAFLTYFLFRLLLDFPDFSDVRALTIGTDGGVLFGLLLGTLTSSFFSAIFNQERSRGTIFASLPFFALCVWLAWRAYTVHLQSLRADLFLVDYGTGNYQRPGNLTIMITVLASVQLALVFKVRRYGVAQHLALVSCLCAYLVLVGILLVTSQLIGSNTGFVVTGFLAIGTLTWLTRPSLAKFKWSSTILLRIPNPITALRKALPRFVFSGSVFLMLLIACGAAFLALLNIDIEQLRIFSFSERNPARSLVGRLDLLERNFLTQFAYSPIFGNANVDALTTGGGSYAHSLISLLPHLGLIGTALFVAYVAALVRELRSAPPNAAPLYVDLDLAMLRIVILGMILIYALVGTFFTWLPLWFSLGLLCPPMLLSRSRGTIRLGQSAIKSETWA